MGAEYLNNLNQGKKFAVLKAAFRNAHNYAVSTIINNGGVINLKMVDAPAGAKAPPYRYEAILNDFFSMSFIAHADPFRTNIEKNRPLSTSAESTLVIDLIIDALESRGVEKWSPNGRRRPSLIKLNF